VSEQIENDSWIKLGKIFDGLDENCIEKAVKDFKVKEICVDGIASKIYGKKKVEYGFNNLLQKMGFSEEEIKKSRLCVISDCQYTQSLYNMLNHFIGYHQVPAQNISKLITALKNDTRELPNTVDRIKYNLRHPQMTTD